MENEIAHNRQEQKVPALLLHSCCAPCSSYCLETLSEDFAITVFIGLFSDHGFLLQSEYLSGRRILETGERTGAVYRSSACET